MKPSQKRPGPLSVADPHPQDNPKKRRGDWHGPLLIRDQDSPGAPRIEPLVVLRGQRPVRA